MFMIGYKLLGPPDYKTCLCDLTFSQGFGQEPKDLYCIYMHDIKERLRKYWVITSFSMGLQKWKYVIKITC